MSSRTSDIELYRLVARELDCTANTARKYVDAIVEVIAKEVYLSGCCRVPNLGIFDAKEIKESKQRHKDENGDIVEFTVPEHIRPTFTPCDAFINDCNLRGVTKEYRKRAKKKVLTKRDLERIAKAEALNRLRSISNEDKEQAKIDFSAKLKEKREKHGEQKKAEEEAI